MDNTFFVGITSIVGGTVGLALVSCVVIAGLILGAIVGYRLYKNFVGYGDWLGGREYK